MSLPRLNPPHDRRCLSYTQGRASVGAYTDLGVCGERTRGPHPTSRTKGRLNAKGDASRVGSSAVARAAARGPPAGDRGSNHEGAPAVTPVTSSVGLS